MVISWLNKKGAFPCNGKNSKRTKNMQNMCVASLTLTCKGLPIHEPKLASFMVKHVAFLSKSPKILVM